METIDKSLPDFFPELIGPNEVGSCSLTPFLRFALLSVEVTYGGRASGFPDKDMARPSAFSARCVRDCRLSNTELQ